jgi:transcriptional regulator with XRE-family HTH domain
MESDTMNRIKQLREENKWTQLDLAHKLNCAMSSIAMYENESRKPSLEVLVKLSEIFNCSIDYILCKTDIKNIEEDFKFAYHKEIEGLSEDEIKEALEFYKMVKNRKNK